MLLTLIRNHHSPWGIDGTLYIDGHPIADTTEHPTHHLPLGIYTLTRKRILFRRGNGPMLNTDGSICVGEHYCSGCVLKTREIFAPLHDRIRKTLSRGKPVTLIIKCFLIALLLTGCSNLRRVQIVEHATHDTLYVNTIQFDSIYIDNWHSTDRSKDTVYIHDILRENHYKLLRDTIRISKTDSIPIIHEVEKPVKYVPSIYKWSLGICVVSLILLIPYIVWKIKF